MIVLKRYSLPPFEVVERKGLGHPDTLADGVSESISRSLSRFYLDEFGQILHHNVDKVLIVAGRSAPEFGGGKILKPPSVVVGGRATKPSLKPVDEIIEDSVSSFFGQAVKNLEQFRVEPRVEEGAPELRRLIGQGANDTSIGVGFAPLSATGAAGSRSGKGRVQRSGRGRGHQAHGREGPRPANNNSCCSHGLQVHCLAG